MSVGAAAGAGRRALAAVGVAVVLGLAAAALPGARGRAAARPACAQDRSSPAYTSLVRRVLASGRDVWGNALLRAPDGPTYEAAHAHLKPLLLARAAGKTALTDSGVHYVPFSQPYGAAGAGSVALHVADGSQIVSDRVGGRNLSVLVGAAGGERYGSCRARLAPPRLAEGYLPILETRYADAAGARYVQESFATRVPQTGSLVSFLRLTADAQAAKADVRLRFRPSLTGLAAAGGRLVRGGATVLAFSPGGRFDGSSLSYDVPRGSTQSVYLAWVDYPAPAADLAPDEESYDAARQSVAEYWERRLAEGAAIEVPEKGVYDAERNLLIQNLALTWRYSIGNAYEQFSFPESVDVAQVMGEYGFGAVAASILRVSLTRKPTPYPNWKMGEKLVGSASLYRLLGDRSYLERATPTLRRYVQVLGRQLSGRGGGLLGRERYSSDIPDEVYGLHSQAVVWQGLRAMGGVWDETGHAGLAQTCRRLADRLERGLRRAIRVSSRRLPDGSLFVPVRLLDREEAYGALVASRPGSYWNLVMPYALASGIFRARSPEANGVLRYMLTHGSRLLGLVRAGAFALYRDPVYPTSGIDQVYGINVARFLADNDRADQLVLSLYGQLAAGMAEGTFVAGEAASVAPLAGGSYRSMYLPPNSASNAAFLAALRLMLVHETRDARGRPYGLELAYATPRKWLLPGRRTAVREVPTSFGPVSFTIEAEAASVRVALDVPERRPLRTLSLRLRLPQGNRITSVLLDGAPSTRFDPRAETVTLPTRPGRLELVVGFRR